MKQLAVILDSFCGKNAEEIAAEDNIYLLSLQVEIDGINKKVGLSTAEDLKIKNAIAQGSKTKTSMPNAGDILTMFKKTSSQFENVIYLPLLSGVSSTAKAAMGLAQDFKNVSVIETHLVGSAFLEVARHLIKMAKQKECDIDTIKKTLKDYLENDLSPAFVIPKTIIGLVKSGRLSRALLNVLDKVDRTVVISYDRDSNKSHFRGFKRSPARAVDFALAKINAFVQNRPDFKYLVTASPGNIIRNIVESKLQNGNYDYVIEETSPVVYSVVKENAISISAFKKLTTN